jgi:hypothetical protein
MIDAICVTARAFGDPSSIGSGNGMNYVLIPRYMGSIPTEVKNFSSEGGGEDREVAVETT